MMLSEINPRKKNRISLIHGILKKKKYNKLVNITTRTEKTRLTDIEKKPAVPSRRGRWRSNIGTWREKTQTLMCKTSYKDILYNTGYGQHSIISISGGVPWQLSRLRIWHCHSCGSGYSCGMSPFPDSGTSACHRQGGKKMYIYIYIYPLKIANHHIVHMQYIKLYLRVPIVAQW